MPRNRRLPYLDPACNLTLREGIAELRDHEADERVRGATPFEGWLNRFLDL
ncbi:MAG: hypothetical protein U0835_17920 [Isosphaeraceae bacterium]